MGTVLVLPQNDVTVFVDSPWEATHSLRSGWVVGWGEGGGSKRKLRRGKWDWCAKDKKTVLKKEKYVMHIVIIYVSNNINIIFNHCIFNENLRYTVQLFCWDESHYVPQATLKYAMQSKQVLWNSFSQACMCISTTLWHWSLLLYAWSYRTMMSTEKLKSCITIV